MPVDSLYGSTTSKPIDEIDAIAHFRLDVASHWDDHISFTRDAITSIMHDLEDLPTVVERLMMNQDDIGEILAPHYGTEAAMSFAKLLKNHVSIAADVVRAVKKGESIAALETKWKENAVAIATLLHSLDPINWPKEVVLAIFLDHIICLREAIVAHAAKKWAEEIIAYDKGHVVSNTLADLIAKGIVNKFMGKFIHID